LESSLDTSVALPDSSWGIGAGHWFNDNWYVLGGINDANGFGSDDLEWFEGGSEFFKYGHVGWSPSKDERYFRNIHLLVWDVDEREDLGIDSANGVSLAMNWTWNNEWMPFARIGFSDGDAPIYNESVTVGLIKKYLYRSDLYGFAFTWGDPPQDALPSQKTFEAFWRFQLAETLAITPSIQYLKDPALNPEEDSVWIFGLRTRLAL
jgi:porin